MEHDVVVVGHGGAGAAAAIEAARAGADTLVLERMSGGGGTTALSTGVCYFGGGTAVQKACGFEDSVPDMIDFVRLAAGRGCDEERIRLFCEGSAAHFAWFQSLGVEFKESYTAEKTTHPFTDDCLHFSGNELVHPFVEQARPAPRGHKPARPGEAGAYLMQVLVRATQQAGARTVYDCRVGRLIQTESGRVVGVEAMLDGRTTFVKAGRAVVLCAGGFIMNDEMLSKHAPTLLRCNYKAGSAGDDGAGILIGMGAGADAVNMSEGLVLNAYYPPGSHAKGIIVNAQGQRFVNEDAYIGRASDAMLHKADGRAWLIVDNEIYGKTQVPHRLAAVEDSFADLEKSLAMPEGELVHTIDFYNRHAAQGEDPLFRKAEAYLRPLSTPPYAALDCTTEGSIYGALTLGGLATTATGEVLDAQGRIIAGLSAAGRNAAGVCREGRTYASGLSIADATFFGRLAGKQAAAAPAWQPSAGG
jgi:succinate dehydrogenase/fumarate reductase flavoprotein subunit